ncbi:MAG TPA: type I 3-dehydroquinate dehydratase, partial [Thermoanaerobaculia bacterium]|nr:type I 3-dehydroquinate dehydratase [Thermoanaerobaculia bacterium]
MALTAERTSIVGSFAPAAMADAREAASPAAGGPGVVEVRLDAFREPADLPSLRACFGGKTLLATLRSAREGGGFSGSSGEARSLLSAALSAGFDLVDVEFRSGENAGLMGLPPDRVVLSVHDLEGLPADLADLADRMRATGARHVKIVGTANDSSDALRLLEAQAALSPGNVSLLAMGEAGIATRVLAPYLGAPLAFGALLPGRGTAPGQVAAGELEGVYGVGRRRRAGRLVALLGDRVAHSLSPALHNARFEALGEEALYVPFALRSLVNELPALREGLARLGLPLSAASITIPFKEEAAALADASEPVNTLLFGGDGRIRGANTDAEAMETLIPPAGGKERALVLGAGGTARIAVGVLRGKGYEVFVSARDRERGETLASRSGASFLSGSPSGVSPRVLVNATPLGLGADDPLPCDPSLLTPGLLVVDAPYRAGGTALEHPGRTG